VVGLVALGAGRLEVACSCWNRVARALRLVTRAQLPEASSILDGAGDAWSER